MLMLSVKLRDMAAHHGQQTYEVERQQTAAINELMDETNSKLSKMQADYDQLLQSTVITVIISNLLMSLIVTEIHFTALCSCRHLLRHSEMFTFVLLFCLVQRLCFIVYYEHLSVIIFINLDGPADN